MADSAISVVSAPITPLERHSPALTSEELEVLRATVLAGATDAQLKMYAISCNRRGLDPFSKEVYGFVNRDGGIELVVSIDGLRKKAEESGQYRGQTQQQWCGPDGEWQGIWLRKEPPAAARITVHREGHEPFTGVATWQEFGRPSVQSWKQYPSVMLSKIAEASAIRHLFPNQTQGLYIKEEVGLGSVEAHFREQSDRDRTGRGRVAASVPRPAAVRRVDPQTSEIHEPDKPFDPRSDHEQGWREYVLGRKDELGISTVQFNTLRRQLKLPLVERMDVAQCKALYEAMLNLTEEEAADEAPADDAGETWVDDAGAIDADFEERSYSERGVD